MAISTGTIISIVSACVLFIAAAVIIGYLVYNTLQQNSKDCQVSDWSACDSTGNQTRTVTQPAVYFGSCNQPLTQTCTPPSTSSGSSGTGSSGTGTSSGSGSTGTGSGTSGTGTSGTGTSSSGTGSGTVPTGVYSSLPFTDFPGQGDISSSPGTASSCQATCDSITGCTGYTLSSGNCFFKNNTVTTPSYNSNATYYYKGAAPASGAAYGSLANTDYPSQGDISNQTGTSATCSAACNNITGCIGFVYNTSNNTCFFKNNTAVTPYFSPSATFYYKGAAPSAAGQNCYVYSQLYGNRYMMYPGDILYTCGMLKTPDGVHTLNMQPDGNLVLTNTSTSKVTWSSGSYGKGTPPYTFTYQTDGNCVIYDSGKSAIWSTGTNGKTSTILVLQNDGNLVLYNGTPNNLSSDNSVSGNSVWSTGTYNI